MTCRHVKYFGHAGGNAGVGVDMEGILPVHRELMVVCGITCHGIYESEGCEFIYTVTSHATSCNTHEPSLMLFQAEVHFPCLSWAFLASWIPSGTSGLS